MGSATKLQDDGLDMPAAKTADDGSNACRTSKIYFPDVWRET
jgi:hypothetical protein